jgi:hypothetical protein
MGKEEKLGDEEQVNVENQAWATLGQIASIVTRRMADGAAKPDAMPQWSSPR